MYHGLAQNVNVNAHISPLPRQPESIVAFASMKTVRYTIGMTNFSLLSAFEVSKNGGLKNWAISYLNSEGNNRSLASIIQDTECRSVELIEAPLDDLVRICGPEKEMIFWEAAHIWESRLITLQQAIREGAELPPLIVTNFWGSLQVSDGAHRLEALKRNGISKYWAIIFEKN